MMRDRLLWLGLIIMVAAGLAALERWDGAELLARLVSLAAIWSVAAVALNVTNGTTGMLNLGQHGFMLVGAYVTALLASPKVGTVLMAPWVQALNLNWLTGFVPLQMVVAVLAGGAVAAICGVLIGIPSLRLRGDYLAIVTLGFGEAIRYVAATDQGAALTNGGLGIRGIPGALGSPVWAFGWLVVTIWFLVRFTQSSYGRALKAIREDEMAAQAIGINLAYHKVLAFALSAAFAGIAGGLYASWLRTIDPNTFQIFLMTYLLVAVSVGGIGSHTGAVLGTALVVLVRQYLQPIERAQPPGQLLGWIALVAAMALVVVAVVRIVRTRTGRYSLPVVVSRFGPAAALLAALGVALVGGFSPLDWMREPRLFSGLRNVALALCLGLMMVYRPLGALGRAEFGWDLLFGRRRAGLTEADRRQDAWLSQRSETGRAVSGRTKKG